MADLNEVMRALGRLEATGEATKEVVEDLREDFHSEKEAARSSRKIIHQRLDEQNGQISHLETTVAISGQIDAQLRDELAELKTTVANNHAAVQPHIEDMKRMKTMGMGITGLIALAGLTVGGIVVYASDMARAAIKHWLG